ncbi:MAG: GTP 3',8-cyclase MoaA [Candidatus Njordarchaeia archaeon]
MVLYDSYGRPVLNLRIAVNDICNLNCFFCHGEGEFKPLHCTKGDSVEEMTKEQILTVVKVAASFGVREIKITGGEPLLRRDIVELVEGIAKTPGIKEVSMVTNGLLLEKYAFDLKEAGLKRVNVSLHSLKPEIYAKITGYKGRDGPKKVIRGILKGIKAGLNPVKINFVVLKGLNVDEIEHMIKISSVFKTPVQFIEYHEPKAFQSAIFRNFYYPLQKLEYDLEKRAIKVEIRRMHHRKRFYLSNGAEVEIVRPMFNPEFCANCTRMRVTSNGEFKPCLMRSDNHVPFIQAFNGGNPIDELKRLFIEAVKRREPYYKYPVEVDVVAKGREDD